MLDIPLGYWHLAVEHVAQGDPDPWYVTYGLDVRDTEDDFNDICQGQMTAFSGAWRSLLWEGVALTGLSVTIGTGGEPIRAFWNNPAAGASGSSSPSLPQNCALLIKKNTILGGRRNQGRCFLPSVLSEGSTNNVGQIEPGTVTACQTAAGSWLLQVQGGTTPAAHDMVVLHNDPPLELAPTPVASLTVSSTISTQRRRLR